MRQHEKQTTFMFLVIALGVLSIALGCTSANVRAQSIDKLWAALSLAHPNIEVDTDATEFRSILRAAAERTNSEREFLILTARSVDWLGDPHMQFRNLGEYSHNQTGASLSSACPTIISADERVWVQLPAGLAKVAEGSPPLPDQAMYQLITVEGVRAGPLGLSLLLAEPGQDVNLKVLSAERTEYVVAVKAHKPEPTARQPIEEARPPSSMPTSTPSSQSSEREVGYIKISHLSSNTVVEQFDRLLDKNLGTKALVIDLRGNPGGLIAASQAILGRFVEGTQPFAHIQHRRTGILVGAAFPVWYSSTILAHSRGRVYHKPVVVMVDSATNSAAELLVIGLRDLRGATIVGSRTGGAGAGIEKITLPNGLQMQFGKLPIRTLDGRSFQGLGLTPDFRVHLDAYEVAKDGERAIAKWWLETTLKAFEVAAELGHCQEKDEVKIKGSFDAILSFITPVNKQMTPQVGAA